MSNRQPQHKSLTVFISYTHDSPAHRARVLDLANRIREMGIECHLDQYEMNPTEGWPRWMVNMIEKSTFVLVVCSENYNRRFIGSESGGAQWEGAVITQAMYDQNGENSKFIPVGFQPHTENQYIPSILRPWTYHDVSTDSGFEGLYRYLTEQPPIIPPKVGLLRPMAPKVPGLRTLDLTRDSPKINTKQKGE